MKVKHLIETLRFCDPELDIVLQKDPEGNGFYTSVYVDPNGVLVRNGGDIDVYSSTWTHDEACLEKDEWDRLKSSNRCVIIAP